MRFFFFFFFLPEYFQPVALWVAAIATNNSSPRSFPVAQKKFLKLHYKCPLIHMVCNCINTHTHTPTHPVWQACVGTCGWGFPMTHCSNTEEGKKRGFSQIPYRSSKMFPSPIIADLSSCFHSHYIDRAALCGRHWREKVSKRKVAG